MQKLYDKIGIAHDRLERYKDEVLEVANAQIDVAVLVIGERLGNRRRWYLPYSEQKWYRAHSYLNFDSECMEIKFCNSDETSPIGEMKLHPIMADMSVPLEERKEKFRQFLIAQKTAEDDKKSASKTKELQAKKEALERELQSIDEQLNKGK